MNRVFSQRYETHKTKGGFAFTFYCDLCDRNVTSGVYFTKCFDDALSEAQAYAKRYFNMCHTCGKWICDEHYAEDDMQCIICSSQKERRPPEILISGIKTCPRCGRNNENCNCFCHCCGKSI